MKIFIFSFFSLLIIQTAFTQCVIDTTITTYGFHPDTGSFIKPGCNGSWYESSVQIYAPDSVFVGGNTYAVNYVRPDSVKNLPSGISFSTNPFTGILAGGDRGCINFSGQLNAPVGTYYFTIYYTANFDLFGGTSLNFTAPYRLQVFNGNITYGSLSDTICSFQTYNFNGNMLGFSGIYMDTLTNAVGCDSVLTLELAVRSFDTLVVKSLGGLKAPSGFSNYTWRNCLTQNVLASGTDSVFVPFSPMSVSVSYGDEFCSYTSPCIDFLTSLGYFTANDGVIVFPNPVTEKMYVRFNNEILQQFVMKTIHGRELITIYEPLKNEVVDVSRLPGGVYFIEVELAHMKYLKKVLIC